MAISFNTSAIEISDKSYDEAIDGVQYEEDFRDLEEDDPEAEKVRNEETFNDTSTIDLSVLWWIIGFALALALVFLLARALTEDSRNEKLDRKALQIDGDELSEESFLTAQEELMETNLDHLLQIARNSGNWNHIVRIRFLMVIQTLADHQKITWAKSKTNGDYFQELNGNLSTEFKLLTQVYEHAWFSGRTTDEQTGRMADSQMTEFIKQVEE